MLIWRVEAHSRGGSFRGVYQSNAHVRKILAGGNYYKRPSPAADGIDHDDFAGKLFGFASVDDLVSWFDDHTRIALNAHPTPTRVVVLDVDVIDVIAAKHQCVFDRENAKPVAVLDLVSLMPLDTQDASPQIG